MMIKDRNSISTLAGRESVADSYGFTLIELLMVLLLIVSVTGIVSMSYATAWRNQQRKDTAGHMLTLMQMARQESVAMGKNYRFNLDIKSKPNRYWLTVRGDDDGDEDGYRAPTIYPNGKFEVPGSLTIRWDKPMKVVENGYITFSPDGSVEPTCITLIDRKGKRVSLFSLSSHEDFRVGDMDPELQIFNDEK